MQWVSGDLRLGKSYDRSYAPGFELASQDCTDWRCRETGLDNEELCIACKKTQFPLCKT